MERTSLAYRRCPLPLLWIALALAAAPAVPQATPALARYLPAGVAYSPEVPVPSTVLGFEVGERPVTPGELEAYLRRLAAASDRVRLEEQGRTHEGRPQLLLTFSSPANLQRLEAWRQAHLALSDPARPAATAAELAAAPLVVWLAYSIHGDEASGSNASMLVAYHLAAARDPAVEALLARAVVLVDPSQNPDGMARFASWIASHGSAQPVGDPQHREKRQVWPGGRGNHYWLDLNRDWLATEQPESRARVATFQRWRPHVVGDYHEMGRGASYFFQPGVPERTHPLTDRRNQELTAALARFHASAFDRAGRPYFTRESYDDFYYGKGSTYPDIQGAVGVLFEQSTTSGRVIETGEGEDETLDFPTAVHDHLLASLSTLEGALALRDELVRLQVDFYRQPAVESGGWVCGGDTDRGRVDGFARLLRSHGIELTGLPRDVTVAGRRFTAASSFAVPLAQRQHRLATAILEERREFPATAFYDISSWTFSHAWNVPCAAVGARELPARAPATMLGAGPPPAGTFAAGRQPVAWAFEWGAHGAPRALQRLLAAGVRARVALRPLTATTPEGPRAFAAGAIVVPAAAQRLAPDEVTGWLARVAAEEGVDVDALQSGLVESGVDLGSHEVRSLAAPRVALVVGEGVAATAAGALWHALDRHFAIPVTLLDRHLVDDVDLGRYTHLLLPDGNWDDQEPALAEELAGWLESGGVLIALEGAAVWAGEALEDGEDGKERDDAKVGAADPAGEPATASAGGDEPPLDGRYAGHADTRARELVAGAIVAAHVDRSHPLGFGLPRPSLPLFRTGTALLPTPANLYEVVARYAPEPLLSGYLSSRNAGALGGAPALLATRRGAGLLVRFADDPVFRTLWHGGEALLANALFFGPLVDRTPASD